MTTTTNNATLSNASDRQAWTLPDFEELTDDYMIVDDTSHHVVIDVYAAERRLDVRADYGSRIEGVVASKRVDNAKPEALEARLTEEFFAALDRELDAPFGCVENVLDDTFNFEPDDMLVGEKMMVALWRTFGCEDDAEDAVVAVLDAPESERQAFARELFEHDLAGRFVLDYEGGVLRAFLQEREDEREDYRDDY